MKTTLITCVEPNYTLTSVVIAGQLVATYKGVIEPVSVHKAINYRAENIGDLIPFVREYSDYYLTERLRIHLPYFKNAKQLY